MFNPTKKLNFYLPTVTFLVSILVMSGWFLNIPEFIQIYKAFVPMQFNTALCFFIISLSIFSRELKLTRIAIILSVICLIISSLTGLQYLLGINLGIDQLIMKAYITVKTVYPGRMSPITAFCFTLTSAIIIVNLNYKLRNYRKFFKYISLTPVIYFSLTAVVRYILGESGVYVWQIYTQMAFHTSFCFLVLSGYFLNSELQRLTSHDKKNMFYSITLSFSFFLVFIIISTEINKSEKKTIAKFFLNESQSLNSKIHDSLESRVNALERMAARMGNNFISKKEFIEDAIYYVKHFNDIQAIEKISNHNLIEWIAPTEGNEIVLDKILNQEPSRSDTMTQSLELKKPLFSPTIQLYQGGKGTILYIPIFNTKGNHEGYLVTVFKLKNLINSLVRSETKKYNLEFFQDDKSIYSFSNDKESLIASNSIFINKYGISWKLKISPKNKQIQELKSYYPEIILLLGTIVSLFLGNMLFLILRIKLKNKEIQKTAQIKSDFLANMSHEIRTPLNGIIGMSELLNFNNMTEENSLKLSLVKRSAQSLLLLVNDVLDLAKFENSNTHLESRNVNLEQIIMDLADLFSRTALDKKIEFKYSIAPNSLLWINGDETRIKQILTNLISNSMKFTNSGFISIHLETQKNEKTQEKMTCFYIEDSGIGIAADSREHIFDKFTQADSSTTRKYGGTGLGLAICKSLIEQMNGQIELESQVGIGTKIKVSLPLDVAIPLKSSTIVPLSFSTSADIKILVAEDNDINQIVISGLLKKIGFQAELCFNGIEVLNLLKSKKYDIIFMDCQMPEMDGFETTKKIIELYHEDRPRIVAITASTLTEDIQKCYDSGMDAIISKPIDIEELRKTFYQLSTLKNEKIAS